MTRTIKSILILIAAFCFSFEIKAIGQTNCVKQMLDSLKYLSGDPFDCNSLTWKIIIYKKDAIQPLIDKLGDTTATKAIDTCKTTFLRVGDIAYLTLSKIIPLPFFRVTGMQFDLIEHSCQLGIFEYLESNRIKFQQQVQSYYDKEKRKLHWKKFHKWELTDCYVKNSIEGRYE